MILKLQPELVSILWDKIKYAVESTAPHFSNKKGEKIASNILFLTASGHIEIWADVDKKEEEYYLKAVAATKTYTDDIDESRVLYIYLVFSFESSTLDKNTINNFIDTMRKYAKELNCDTILFSSYRSGVMDKFIEPITGVSNVGSIYKIELEK